MWLKKNILLFQYSHHYVMSRKKIGNKKLEFIELFLLPFFFKLICFQLLQQTLNCEDKFSGNNRLIRVIYTKKNNEERSEFSVSDQHTHEENISWLALCKLKQCSYMTTRDMRHEMFKKFPIVVSCCCLFYFIFFSIVSDYILHVCPCM